MNEIEFKNKKTWLDFLYYNIGKQNLDFELAGTFRKKDGEVGFSKWKKYSECIFPINFDGTSDNWKEQKFFEQINQRQILQNEIVIDLEEKKTIFEVIKKLDKLRLKYYIFDTKSRGYHIHIFFNEKFSSKEKLAIIKHCWGDEQKDGERCLISCEYSPHWKSGKIKEKYI